MNRSGCMAARLSARKSGPTKILWGRALSLLHERARNFGRLNAIPVQREQRSIAS